MLSVLRYARCLLPRAAVAALLCLAALPLHAMPPAAGGDLVWRQDAGSPLRYVSAQGQRAFVGGYGAEGLELWAYPVEMFRNYRVAFRRKGSTTLIDGRDVLSAVEVHPDRTTRVYLGAGFIVRETILVPFDRPAAIIRYEVEGSSSLEIVVRATPVLDLMWPAGMGGQSLSWSDAAHAYLLSEPAYGFQAAMASPQMSAHDPTGNDRQSIAGGDVAFTLTPDGNRRASVFVTLNESRGGSAAAAVQALEQNAASIESETASHWSRIRAAQLQLTTPDERVNRAFAWAEMAVEQAWSCNPELGCGFVGGFGPSHSARRPQYAWYFAGDGLIAAEAAVDAGDAALARRELEFILRYRDQKSGMIWHELSQSAALIDWKGKYPYMYVHVDITFQFLAAVARYVEVTGDADFVRAHWDELAAAYRYCASVIDPVTALPRIPADKEGGNEQDRMADDLGLSTAWVEVSAGFARLAELEGNPDLAEQARTAERSARAAIPARYWDQARQFWINGHRADGSAIEQLRSGPTSALSLELFGPDRTNKLLDDFATSDFETDWGARGLSSRSGEYDPESYAKGSVWPYLTASLAESFWREHRPLTAFATWRSLLPVAALDAPGHLHEVLSGAVFAPQRESVPEQTWSSAGLVSATVHGLLGLETDPAHHRVQFAPRFPAEWTRVRIEQVRVGDALLALEWRRSGGQISLQVENQGEPVRMEYAPGLPLGATLQSARLGGAPLQTTEENHSQETRAHLAFTAPHGASEVTIQFSGGVSISVPQPELIAGDTSSQLRIIATHLEAGSLGMEVDAPCGHESPLELRSPWKITPASGVQVRAAEPDRFEATVAGPSCAAGSYQRIPIAFAIQR